MTTVPPVDPASPTPVEVVAPNPIPVEVVGGGREVGTREPSQHVQRQSIDPSVPARTTFQEDLTTAGQRQINLIWERTQAIIALMVVTATMVSGIIAMIWENKQIPTIIGVAFGMVTGFYFSRTNHAAIGGVGRKPNEDQAYRGR